MTHRRTIITRSLLAALAVALAPGVVADNDPIPDPAENTACGFPTFASTVNGGPQAAGRCAGLDYTSPAFEPAACAECDARTAYSNFNQPLTPGQDVESIPVPPEDVPAQGPFYTPPVEHAVGTLQGHLKPGEPDNYCVTFVPASGTPLQQCADLGSLAVLVPPFGPVPLVDVDSQPVGPTPGVPAGSIEETPEERVPAYSADVVVGIRWVESRLDQRLSGLVTYWEPVALDESAERQWWIDNGHKTTVDLVVVLREDGAPVRTIEAHLPYAGQAAAALMKNAGL